MDSDSLREDSKEEFVKGIDENQQLIDEIENEISEIIPEEGKLSETEQETYKNPNGDKEQPNYEDEEDKEDLKKITKKNKVHTENDIKQLTQDKMMRQSDDTVNDLSENEDQKDKNYEKSDTNENHFISRIESLKIFTGKQKKYYFDVTFIDDLMKGIHPSKLMKEDFALYELDRQSAEDGAPTDPGDNFLTYESVILLNFDLTNDPDIDMDYAQLCCRNYASDACYPVKVEENQFSELSRFRIVPQLKYKNHMKLIDALRDEESQS